MLRINGQLMERIRAHAAAAYPHECCGALLGRDGVEPEVAREVESVLPLENRREDSRHNRFEVTAEDVRAAERQARERGLELVGWYHSHPDHPARPSEFDREHAWPWYSYVIVRAEQDGARELRSWRLGDDRSSFVEEDVEMTAEHIQIL
ncbi:MAG TPA: M67 family metallopeptidase [Candidatus Acidoferrales bacterium]